MKKALLFLALTLICSFGASAHAEPALELSTGFIVFDPTQTSISFNITNSGTDNLSWEISSTEPWLTVSETRGSGDATVIAYVDRTGLPDFDTYGGGLLIASNGGDAEIIVTLKVSSTGPILGCHPGGIAFNETRATNVIRVYNVGIGRLDWEATTAQPWVEFLSPTTGSGSDSIMVGVDVTTLPYGKSHEATIVIESNGGTRTVSVTALPPAAPSGGVIGLYADTGGTTCEISDSSPGLLQLYVIHTGISTATACQFAAPIPSCMSGATWLSDTQISPFVYIGDSQTGISIAYGECLAGPIHVLTINILVQGSSETCCEFRVIPDPKAFTGQILATDCLVVPNLLEASGSSVVINPDASCPCVTSTVKIENTSWGCIKALYAD